MNRGLGGSIELGDYLFPVNLSVEKTRSILEDQAEEYNDEVTGSTQPYFSIETSDVRCDLLYTDEENGVKAVALYDPDIDETQGFWKIDDILHGDGGVSE